MKTLYHAADYKAVHVIGNGLSCAYFRGIDIIDTFGPHYSVPSLCTMELQCPSPTLFFESSRKEGSAIWTHQLFEKDAPLGSITDFIPPNEAVLIRQFDLKAPLNFLIHPKKILGFQKVSQQLTKGKMPCFACESKEGTLIYSTNGIDRGYVSDRSYFMSLAGSEGTCLSKQDHSLVFTVQKGFLVFSYSETLPDAIDGALCKDEQSIEALYQQTEAFWKTFTEKRRNHVPLKHAEIEKAADDIAVLIKCQQGKGGGILAGYNYHLSYVRDNYGTFRGLLSMGCYDEARALLTYYRGVFARHGRIHNAQGMEDNAFHIHENDAVEITGYMVLMITDFYEISKDTALLQSLLPLSKWCILQQHAWLKKGMLPFNGDETYIAGGIIPRTVLCDASMEAVLLYHTACTRLLELQSLFEGIEQALFALCEKDRQEIESTFEKNFIIENKIACNNPNYPQVAGYPPSRPGVMQCGHGFGASFKNKLNQYVCLDCLEKGVELPQSENKIYYLNSVALMPRFIKSTLIKEELLAAETARLIGEYMEKGTMPSSGEGAIVGYDLGLFINALPPRYKEEKKMLLTKMLSLRDAAGAWVEYYIHDKPDNTMCRPWESGINIMAAVGMDKVGNGLDRFENCSMDKTLEAEHY